LFLLFFTGKPGFALIRHLTPVTTLFIYLFP
jgi:hypothetical protein